MNESQNLGNNRPAYRKPPQGRRSSGQRRAGQGQGRVRATAPQLHGRGYQTPGQRRRNANGYQLQRHPINFAGRRGFANATDPRLIIVLAIALVAVVLVIFNIVSCVGQSGKSDATVATGVSQDLGQQLTQAVSEADQMKAIAAAADQYPESLVRLALDEPAAVPFVYGYLEASKDAQAFDLSATAGTVSALYDWDSRWGALDYAGQPMAVSGSGPVALTIARMALLGEADQTPVTLAQAATAAGKASGDAGTDASFFTDKASDLGLSIEALDMSKPLGDSSGEADGTSDDGSQDQSVSDGTGSTDGTDSQGTDGSSDAASQAGASRLSAADLGAKIGRTLGEETYLLAQTNGGALGSQAHWVLVCLGENGAVRVFDPTSTQNTSHEWDPATVAGDLSQALVVGKPQTT